MSHPTVKMSFHSMSLVDDSLFGIGCFQHHNIHLIKVLDNACNRFEVPDTNDTGRWTNRVVNNLIYYQTNYFVSALIVFSLIRLVQIPCLM